jgi:uncharacterized protein YjbI with pentapeptide repeats
MKVVKDMEHGLLLNYFGLNNRFYLSVTIMTFFDFNNPDQPISEQKLWPFVQEELGKEAVFDMAMPKPKGEVIVWGRCFTPEGKPRPASQVFFQLGPIKKTLYIFGNRYWKRSGMGMIISDPEPFTEMPVIYERAFGGSGFDKNPLGRGINPVAMPAGKEAIPLPNIEDPKHLIGSPKDRPEPAGFGPLDFTWPQRSKKLGTYDNKWFRERWPFYPEDMDWTYFDASPEDQQMELFFNGSEKITVGNMHKTKPIIESRLPNLRHRLFINQLANKNEPEGEKIFREINANIDTVWLFPHMERGVVIYRGNAEIADDEALDVPHLYIATEDPSIQAKTIEQFHEEFEKRLDRKIPESAVAAKAKAREKLAEAAERLKDLPQEIADSFAAGLGKMPAPVRTHAETLAMAVNLIDQQIPNLDAGEKRLLEAKAKFSHIAKIDTSGFQIMRNQFSDTKAELQGMYTMLDEMTADTAATQKEMGAAYKKALSKIDPVLLKEKGIDPNLDFDIFKKTPEDLWHEQGMRFIEHCRDNLELRPEYLKIFVAMGLRRYTIKRSWIGINAVRKTDDPALWGLAAEDKNRENPKELDLPTGLVVPCFERSRLHRIKIISFHHVYPPPDFPSLAFREIRSMGKDILIEGSGKMAMVQGADEGKPFVRVAREFEALLLHQELGGFCAVIAMENQAVKPDKETEGFLKKAPQFLVIQYPDSKEPADGNMDIWKKIYPQAEPLYMPAGTNLFEAKKLGVDLWQWVADALHSGIAPDPEIKPKEVDINKPGALAALIPTFDVAAIIQKTRDTMMAEMQPEIDLMEKQKKEMMDIARKTLESKGLNADKLLKPAEMSAEEEANPFASMKKQYAEQFSDVRKQLKKQGVLAPDVEKRIAEAEKASSDLLTKAAAQYEEGTARLADAEKKIAAGPPDWAKKLLSDAGIDPEDPTPMRQLTREEVVERHEKGISLAGKNLSGVDLSGLDLRGADLSRAILKKANMSKCILDGVDFSRVLAGEADFSHASIINAKLTKGIFRSAKFVESNLSNSNLTKALMNEADLSGSTLMGAILEKALLEKAILKKANLSNVKAMQVYFLSTDLSLADLSGADLTKAMFLKANIEETNFSHAVIRSVHFIETKGTKVNFADADMYNSRILNGSAMTESVFTNVRADKASWMKSDLSGSDFRGTVIKRGLIQECNLAGSNLAGISAKETRITKTDLSDVNMEKVNLFQGSLRKAKLVRTNLNKANLYSVEFYRTGVGDTHFEGANLKMTKLYKRTDLIPEKKDKG